MSKILIVDDDKSIREVMRLVLERSGHAVVEAENGLQALARQREQAADLMITEIFLREMDGFETITEMRKKYPALRIIAMSAGVPIGRPILNYLKMAQAFGAHGVLTKPFTMQQLIEAVLAVASPGRPSALPPSAP